MKTLCIVFVSKISLCLLSTSKNFVCFQAPSPVLKAKTPPKMAESDLDDDLFSILDDNAGSKSDAQLSGDKISFFADYVNQNQASDSGGLFD